MSFSRRKRHTQTPPTNPSWIDGQFIVIGLEGMLVSHRGEKLPGRLSDRPDDRKILQFLGRMSHYRNTRGSKPECLLDERDDKHVETGVTGDNRQLRLLIAPNRNAVDASFCAYVCWQEATGHELELMDGSPPPAAPVPSGE